MSGLLTGNHPAVENEACCMAREQGRVASCVYWVCAIAATLSCALSENQQWRRLAQAAAVLPVAVSRGEEVVYDTPYTTDDGCLLFSRALKRLDPAPVRPT